MHLRRVKKLKFLQRAKINSKSKKALSNLTLILFLANWIFGGFVSLHLVFKPEVANAAIGSSYIARASGNLITNNSLATEQTLTYDTEVKTSVDVVRQAGNQAFRIQNSGRYLIIANTRWDYSDIGNNNRHVVRTQIKVGGTPLDSVYGMASGYGRDAGNADEDGAVVAAYIDHTVSGGSADDITVHVQNFGDTGVALADQLADQSGIQIVRLPDDSAYLKVSRDTDINFNGTLGYNTNDPTWNEFGWEKEDAENDPTVVEWVSGNDVTLKSAGHYMVIYSIRADSTGNSRRAATYRLKLDDVEVPNSRVLSFMRGQDGTNESWAQWAGIIEASTNDVLNIDWGSASESAGGFMNDATMTVVKLPDTASYIRLRYDSNRDGETTGAYSFNQADEDDEGVYDITKPSQIAGSSNDHDWLLFGSWFARTATADTTRVSEHFRWFRNGSEVNYGSGLSYHRGDQGANGVPAGGRNAIVVAHDLGVADYMELNLRHESGNGNQNRDFIGDTVGITGVVLETLGSLTVDIVDGAGSPVASPAVSMNPLTFSFNSQTAGGTLGTVSAEKIRVENNTGHYQWNVTLAPAGGPTDFWDSAGANPDYDFNDPTAGGLDGGDTDSIGGQMTVDASVGLLGGTCTSTGITQGSSASYSEGVVDSITLLSAGASADRGCYWDFTGVDISQTVPPEQAVDSYSIDMVLTLTII